MAQLILFYYVSISSVDYGDKQLGFDVPRGAAGDKNSEFLSSPKQWPVNHIIPQETLEHEHNFTASVSDPRFLKSNWVNRSLPLKQPGLGSGNHFTFPREQVTLKPFELEFFILVFLLILMGFLHEICLCT